MPRGLGFLRHGFVVTIATLCFLHVVNADIKFSDIEMWIKNGEVKTIDDVVARMPEIAKNNAVFMHTSQSLHQSDYNHPRVILTEGLTGLFLGFSTLPQDPRYQLLEAIQFNPVEKKFDFSTVDFNKSKPTISHNPHVCMHCHAGHPIWEAYPFWPGAYFGESGKVAPEEAAAKISFTGRLATLKKPEIFAGDYLSYFTNVYQFRQIAHVINKSEKLRPYRYAILGAYNCLASPEGDGDALVNFVPEEILESFALSLDQIYADTLARAVEDVQLRVGFIHGRMKRASVDPEMETLFQTKQPTGLPYQVARMRYLVENLGESMDEWSMDFGQNLSFGNGGKFPDSGIYFFDAMTEEFDDMPDFREFGSIPQSCGTLARLSEAELKRLNK